MDRAQIGFAGDRDSRQVWGVEIASLRKSYEAGELNRADLDSDPLVQFGTWFREAGSCDGVIEVNAMTLSTSDRDGRVTARTVLLKGISAGGFDFYTNIGSRKAVQMVDNPVASLLFYWAPLERQVSIEGAVARISNNEVETYFHSRPRSSQLGAWASQQSAVIADRSVVEEHLAELEAEYANGLPIPVPPFWGGYRVTPTRFEFWQGRPSRLHDRFEYVGGIGADWEIRRLSP